MASQASPLHMDAQQDLQEKNSEIPSPKFNMEPENYAFQKESPFSTSWRLGSMLNFRGVSAFLVDHHFKLNQ